MSRTFDDAAAIDLLEQWFKSRCDGNWEHRYGLTIETTDNPGWLVTFDGLAVSRDALAALTDELLHKFSAQVATDGTQVQVYSPLLRNSLAAAAIVISTAMGTEKKLHS